MIVMDFREWLTTKKLRSRGPVGDLARDVLTDDEAPRVPNAKEAWLRHLREAPENVVEVFERAWAAYERAMKW